MRQFLPLPVLPLPDRYFSVRKICLYFLSLLILGTQQSCTDGREIRASIDGANEKEGGNSRLNNDLNVGTNVALCFFMAIPKKNTNVNAAVSETATEEKTPLVLSSQLEFIQKGSKFQESKTTLNYLNLVEDVIYRYPMEDKGTLYGGLGPYLGYGLGGHVKTGDFKASAFGGEDGYRRFDAGLHLTAGYKLPSDLSFTLSYEYGLVNKSPAPDFTSRNRTISLDIGYSLDRIIDGFKKK